MEIAVFTRGRGTPIIIKVSGGQEVFVDGEKVFSIFDPPASSDEPVDPRQTAMDGVDLRHREGPLTAHSVLVPEPHAGG